MINGQEYIAEDIGSAVKGNVIDIYTINPEDKETHYTEVLIKLEE